MVWIICMLVLTKLCLIDDYIVLLISNIIVLSLNVLKSNLIYNFILKSIKIE